MNNTTGKCGELVTEGYKFARNGLPRGIGPEPLSEAEINEGESQEELVTRSQAEALLREAQKAAEELLAAEIRRERDLAEKQLSEVVDRMSDDYLTLKAELDQAVGVIEDRSSEYEALEAKLAAAEKDAATWEANFKALNAKYAPPHFGKGSRYEKRRSSLVCLYEDTLDIRSVSVGTIPIIVCQS